MSRDTEQNDCGNCGNEYPELKFRHSGDLICLECARNHGVEDDCDAR